ncbi:hypothetical protein [Chryseobacterium sp.]|uniref:hypothetical protein n=1 Tax=Chryseobacterium sp. TaxID=1871047 RepID=UPI0028990060|nr:hypothetical protein [Chryseobacterium sp.]
MKKLQLLLLFASLTLLQSCWLFKDDDNVKPERQSIYNPVVISRAQLNSISLQAAKLLNQRDKVFVNGTMLYVNDHRDGFHIYDNSNAAQPQKINYLKALGSSTLSFKDNLLYINQATDLVIVKLDIPNNNVQVVKRLANIFPQIMSPDGFNHDVKADEVVIDWKLKN